MRRFGGRLAAIALAGLGLRVLWILAGDWSPDRLIGDAGFYHAVALLVAGGHGFTLPGSPGLPTAAHPPLHPLLLALPSAVGLKTWTAHRLFGAAVGTVTVVLTGLLGRRVDGERTGLVAAALAALYPVFVRMDGSVMSETLYGALIAAVLLVAYRLASSGERPSLPAALGLGALIGAATLTRAEALALLVLLAAPLLLRRPRHPAALAAAVLACALVLAPWAIRNEHAFGRFVPVSTNNGTAVAGANCQRTYYGPDLGFWRFECLDLGRAGSRNEAVESSALSHRARTYASDHAGRVPVVAAARVLRTYDLFQPWRAATFSEGGHVVLFRVGVIAFFVLVPFAVAGAVLLRRRRRPLWPLLAPFVLVTLTAAITLGAERLRYAAEVPLLMLAAVAVSALAGRVRA